MSKTAARQLAAEMNKLLGEPVVLLGSDKKFKVEYLPTGLLPIDIGLQGGIARGRFVCLTGAYSTLKSYIGYKTIAATQQAGGLCALIDTEHAYDSDWAVELGVDTERLILSQPQTGELGIDAARILTQNGIDLIVFDSIAATLPQVEHTKRLHKETQQPGRQAALMSIACRLLTAVNTGRTAFIWINQLREQIGVTFGPTEKQPGGRAMGFYASMIVNIRKAGKITRDKQTFTGDKYTSTKEEVGQTFRLYIEKSKLNRPFREVFFDFRLEEPVGLDLVKFLFTQGVELNLISKRGNTWHYGAAKAVGRDKFLALLAKNQEMQTELEVAIRRAHDLPSIPHPGRRAHPNKKVGASKRSSSANGARRPTQTVEPAASNGTVLRRKTSSRSSTRARRTQ